LRACSATASSASRLVAVVPEGAIGAERFGRLTEIWSVSI
jgi:hypothetical protein